MNYVMNNQLLNEQHIYSFHVIFTKPIKMHYQFQDQIYNT